MIKIIKICLLLIVLLPLSVSANNTPSIEEEGIIEAYHVDGFESGSLYSYKLKTKNEDLNLQIEGDVPDIKTGDKVKVSGKKEGKNISAMGGNIKVTNSVVAASVEGDKKVLVLLVNFSDLQTEPYTIAEVTNEVFTNVNGFYVENSYNHTSLSGDVFGYFTLPTALSSECNYTQIGTEARQAASSTGINLSNYGHIIYIFPHSPCVLNGFSWTGLGTVGGNPSQAWINGSSTVRVIAHEFGHNVGLMHSHGCNTTVINTTCTNFEEYGDRHDVMGLGYGTHFNIFQKIRLGWLAVTGYPSVLTVTQSGNYTIGKAEFFNTLPLGLQIKKTRLSNYYVEKRSSVGYDTGISGVLLHVGQPTVPDSSQAPNFDLNLGKINVGQSFTDSSAKVKITTVSEDENQAIINVQFFKGN